MTRKVFIDLGAFDGDTIRQFREKYHDADHFEIHAFEPDPRCREHFATMRVHFHPVAAWVEDGYVDLYLGDLQSSSLMRDKTSGNIDRDHPVRVECVDFSRWIRQFDGAAIVLKMDVEGVEHAILGKMLDEGSLASVRELWVDWHHHKVNTSQERHDELLDRLNATGIPLHDMSEGMPHFLGEACSV